MDTPIESATRIQEAHGLWELAIARLAAFAECGARPALLEASLERRARRVCELATRLERMWGIA